MPSTFAPASSSGFSQPAYKTGQANPVPASGRGTPYGSSFSAYAPKPAQQQAPYVTPPAQEPSPRPPAPRTNIVTGGRGDGRGPGGVGVDPRVQEMAQRAWGVDPNAVRASGEVMKAHNPEPGTAEYYKSPNFLNHVSGYGGAGMSSKRAVRDYQLANAQGLANKDWASAIQGAFADRAGAWYDTRYVNDDEWNQASEATKNYYLNYGERTGPTKLAKPFDPRSLTQFGGRDFNPLPRPKQPMYQA